MKGTCKSCGTSDQVATRYLAGEWYGIDGEVWDHDVVNDTWLCPNCQNDNTRGTHTPGPWTAHELGAEDVRAQQLSDDFATRTLAKGDKLHRLAAQYKVANDLPLTRDEARVIIEDQIDLNAKRANGRVAIDAGTLAKSGVTLPEGYVREGNRYVYKPEAAKPPTHAKPKGAV